MKTALTEPQVWTAERVRSLGVRTDVPTAGQIITGWGVAESYRAVARGDFPVPVLRVGRRLIVPVAPILKLLGIPDADTHAPPRKRAGKTTATVTAKKDTPDNEKGSADAA
jgi:hypothetical protein